MSGDADDREEPHGGSKPAPLHGSRSLLAGWPIGHAARKCLRSTPPTWTPLGRCSKNFRTLSAVAVTGRGQRNACGCRPALARFYPVCWRLRSRPIRRRPRTTGRGRSIRRCASRPRPPSEPSLARPPRPSGPSRPQPPPSILSSARRPQRRMRGPRQPSGEQTPRRPPPPALTRPRRHGNGASCARAWTERDEKGYEEFVPGSARAAAATCMPALPAPPPTRSTAPPIPPGMHFYADCADLPYMLRAYYAWKNGLPFSYSTAVTPLGFSKDIRYTARGNAITSRRDLTDAGLDARKAIPQVVDTISSAHYRTPPDHAGKLLPDHYPVRISRESIKPGTIIYDPNGHVAVVYKVTPEGRIHYIDTHPDNSLTRGIYGKAFSRATPAMGAGFKRWRPQTLVGAAQRPDGSFAGGHIVLSPDKDIPDWSDEQFFGTERNRTKAWTTGKFVLEGETLEYYDYVRRRLANARLPVRPAGGDAHDGALAVRGPEISRRRGRRRHQGRYPQAAATRQACPTTSTAPTGTGRPTRRPRGTRASRPPSRSCATRSPASWRCPRRAASGSPMRARTCAATLRQPTCRRLAACSIAYAQQRRQREAAGLRRGCQAPVRAFLRSAPLRRAPLGCAGCRGALDLRRRRRQARLVRRRAAAEEPAGPHLRCAHGLLARRVEERPCPAAASTSRPPSMCWRYWTMRQPETRAAWSSSISRRPGRADPCRAADACATIRGASDLSGRRRSPGKCGR